MAASASKKEGGSARKTEKVNVWVTPEQLEWLKSKKNVSETIRALLVEAMNLERLAQSVKAGAKKKTAASSKRK